MRIVGLGRRGTVEGGREGRHRFVVCELKVQAMRYGLLFEMSTAALFDFGGVQCPLYAESSAQILALGEGHVGGLVRRAGGVLFWKMMHYAMRG